MRKLVSLIIPIYNVEKYLPQCFESVYAQTYPNVEVILVNDGSTDNSLDICKRYANRLEWKLINQDNQGLSAARNSGIDKATGDYIMFLDSDDWLEHDMIEKMVNAAEKYKVDIVETGIKWIYPSSQRIDEVKKDIILNKHDALAAYLLQNKPIHSQVCSKLYVKTIFSEVRFEIGRLHEDGFFTYLAMYKANSYALLQYVGYNYRQNRQGSIMTVPTTPRNIKDVTDMMEERISFFIKNNENDLAAMAASYYYRTTLSNYITVKKSMHNQELALILKDKLTQNILNIMKNKWLGIKKLKFVLFFFFPYVFRTIYLREKK